ncbi:hypothetical protein A2960_03045 [Candidatus Gottesmanbacteria bacterium RIFCSPLOWO2_01_FULL_39_12b]|uniref:Asl1-like glycosyl hydrolase catalytic domain-containing protein n=1 Tax=Candidatus Gottesmanbacteria bacterium RIFCSPLOWO2_01_FULL_39_12b TaxID=1798388 RepID=A0A1F6ARE8_9BACT|nr:MAG: hypothetical protein A2960_03045 [Candidatus Gottesmanbacteria bacterium RIFCSPLOWO2_01_FULL_39_12b]
MAKRRKKRVIKKQSQNKLFPFLLLLLILPIVVLASLKANNLFSLGVSNAIPTTLSNSKLGVFFLGVPKMVDWKKVVASGPKIINVLDAQLFSDRFAIITEYKSKYPNGIVILRIMEKTQGIDYRSWPDAASAASDYFVKVIKPGLDKIPADKKNLINFVTGPNESDNIPNIQDSVANVIWVGKFWETLAPLIRGYGFTPLIGDISVGNLEVNNLQYLVPALTAIQKANGAWSYHAYTTYTTSPKDDEFSLFKYRRFHEYLQKNNPDLSNIPMVLTEVGIVGWQVNGTPEKYQEWLKGFDSEMQKDTFVLGGTIYQMGDEVSWPTFNIEPICNWYVSYISGKSLDCGYEAGNNGTPSISNSLSPTRRPTIAVTPKPTAIPVPDNVFYMIMKIFPFWEKNQYLPLPKR